jgi:hypothetical protein
MDWLPEGHLAYVVLDLVRELDVAGVEDSWLTRSRISRQTRSIWCR